MLDGLSLRSKLTLAVALVLGTVLVGVGLMMANAQRNHVLRHELRRARGSASLLAALAQAPMQSGDKDRLAEIVAAMVHAEGYNSAALLDARGLPLVSTTTEASVPAGISLNPKTVAARFAAQDGVPIRLTTHDRWGPIHEVLAPILRKEDGAILGLARIRYRDPGVLHSRSAEVRNLTDSIVIVSALGLLVGLLGARALGTYLTGPILTLRDEMRQFARRGAQPSAGNAPSSLPPSWERFHLVEDGVDAAEKARDEAWQELMAEEGDEIAQLRKGFQLTAWELSDRAQELELSTRQKEQTQRLAEVGILAATVCHEVRNPLNSIEGAVYYLQQEYADEPHIAEYMHLIAQQVQRLNRVTSELLDATRTAPPMVQDVELHALIRETLHSLAGEFASEDIEIVLELDPTLKTVPVDPLQMRQVLENLIENALQAMESGGRLSLATHKQGDHLRLIVADEGKGIPQESLEEVKQPFVTTRTMGTGLGLSIVDRIVKAHQGSLQIRSVLGEGTRITVTLPLDPQPTDRPEVSAQDDDK